MSDNSLRSGCQFYFVQLNAAKEPIPGTMRSKPTNKLDTSNTVCTEGRLPNVQMVAPAGLKQCFPKSGLRYYYLVNTSTKAIIPNSLISRKGRPDRMCIGINSYLEYKIFA